MCRAHAARTPLRSSGRAPRQRQPPDRAGALASVLQLLPGAHAEDAAAFARLAAACAPGPAACGSSGGGGGARWWVDDASLGFSGRIQVRLTPRAPSPRSPRARARPGGRGGSGGV